MSTKYKNCVEKILKAMFTHVVRDEEHMSQIAYIIDVIESELSDRPRIMAKIEEIMEMDK